ncbi:cilia- and flagella-associated protein 97 isoform X2 [Alosa sapidissima]|uniref:cilia- and flagella-associated protein 97 isoform X2 n=1 Tax=Alosa sapidissima TaxID=34773 RepID=UPI001C0967E8|nr:cilia- and flagella-associated protein 97 isoform X2 [Alosa sapidissima]
MYSPKELEGEVDHSFFDSDGEGQNPNHGNSESIPQSPVPHGGRSSNELSINDKRDDNNSQVEDASIDLKEIRKAGSEEEDWNGVEKSAVSDSRNEEKDGTTKTDPGVEIRGHVSSKISSEQRAADNILAHDGCGETADEVKGGRSVLLKASDEHDGSNIGEEDKSQEQRQGRSIADTGSLCSSVSSLHSGKERDSEDDKRPRSRSSSCGSRVSSTDERELEDFDDLDDYALNDFDVNANEDGYQRSEESGGSDEERPPEPPPPRHKPQPLQGTPRKSSGKFRKHSPRPSSSSELESSCSSDAEGYGSSSSELSPPRRALAALVTSSPRRRPRLGSAPGGERARGHGRPALESEDTVTDVTPLSTPDMSPAQSFDLPVFAVKADEPVATTTTTTAAAAAAPAGAGEKPKQHNVTVDLNVTADDNLKKEDSDQEDIFAMETKETSSLNQSVRLEDHVDKPRSSDPEEHSQVSSARDERSLLSIGSSQSDCPSSRQQRRNFSFRNDEVWRIDRENQRLLRELSRPCPRSRSASTSAGSAHTASTCGPRRASGPPAPPRLYHSAINRQREQKRIERENLAFLKRLESVKPSKGITRTEQLADYQRQARYLCTPLPTSTIEDFHSKLETSVSKSSQGGSSRPYSAGVRLGPRPGSRPSPAPTKPSRSTTPRPAWS